MKNKDDITIDTQNKEAITPEDRKKRRALLASVAAVGAGSALPSEWKKPIVDSMLVPAHAQTSDPDGGGGTGTTTGSTMANTATTVVTAAQVVTGTALCTGQFVETQFLPTIAPDTNTGGIGIFTGSVSAGVIATCSDPAGGTFNQSTASGTFTFTSIYDVSIGVTGGTVLNDTFSQFTNTATASFTTQVSSTATTTV